MDLLVLRDLMGHASPETTAGYVHLSPETLAAEYATARAVSSEVSTPPWPAGQRTSVGCARRLCRALPPDLGLGYPAPARYARLTGARQFLSGHPDLPVWMGRPLPVRLADLDRLPRAWPLIGFAVLTGRVRADFDLLAAKHAGRGFRCCGCRHLP